MSLSHSLSMSLSLSPSDECTGRMRKGKEKKVGMAIKMVIKVRKNGNVPRILNFHPLSLFLLSLSLSFYSLSKFCSTCEVQFIKNHKKIRCVLLFAFSFCNPTNVLSFLFKVDALIHSLNLYFLFWNVVRSFQMVLLHTVVLSSLPLLTLTEKVSLPRFSLSLSLSVSLPFLSGILENAPTQTEQNTKKLLLRSVHLLFHFVSIPVQHSLCTRHSQSLHILCSFLLD